MNILGDMNLKKSIEEDPKDDHTKVGYNKLEPVARRNPKMNTHNPTMYTRYVNTCDIVSVAYTLIEI